MPRFMFWFGLVFAVAGTGMGVATWYSLSSSNQLASEGARAEGTVIDLVYRSSDDGGGTYAPVVEFRDQDGNRQLYRSSSGSNPPSYDRGETVEVIYMPGTPERAMIDSFSDRWMVPLILGIFMLSFGGIGYAILFFMIRHAMRMRWLKTHGAAIEADFERCYRDTSTRVNGRSPWRVEASGLHPATDRKEHFVSEQIWLDLTEELEGKKVRVLVNPSSARVHFVDLRRYLDDR